MSLDDAALLDRAGGRPPEAALTDARERAVAQIRGLLGEEVQPDGIRFSALGPGWSSDIDVHLVRMPDRRRLEAAGWLPLGDLLHRLGYRDAERWAVMDDSRVLAAVDLHLGPAPSPVEAVLSRCQRRGEVRVREVLELRQLRRAGAALPARHPVLSAIADVEAGLGGDLLREWWTGSPAPCPMQLARPRLRRAAGRVRRNARARRVVVGLSGVDGSGKSTVAGLLAHELGTAGVPVTRVWARPGMALGWLQRVAPIARRLVGQRSSGLSEAAQGTARAARSRRGALGWAWAALVTLAYLQDVGRQHLRAVGVVVYDRHIPDAIVTLSTVYEGVDLRVHTAVVRWLVPRAHRAWYLRVPLAVSLERKPDPVFGDILVGRQLEEYDRIISDFDVPTLDGTQAPATLTGAILRDLVTGAWNGDPRRA